MASRDVESVTENWPRFIGVSGGDPGAGFADIDSGSAFQRELQRINPQAVGPSRRLSLNDLEINEQLQTVIRGIEHIDANDPWLASQLSGTDANMALSLEFINAVSDEEISGMVLSSLYPDLEYVGHESVERFLGSQYDEFGIFSREMSDDLNEVDKTWLYTLIAPIARDGERVKNVMAQAISRTRDIPLDSREAKNEFYTWLSQLVYAQHGEAESESSGLGRVGAILRGPVSVVKEGITNAWAYAASPEDAAWRNDLSPGQNMAVSFGQTPGSGGWQLSSGIVDTFLDVGADPINLAVGLGAGARLAKTFARLPGMTRAATFSKAAVPWFGKNVTSLPVLSRGYTTRLGWALASNSAEELVYGPNGLKTAQRIYNLLKADDGVGRLLEEMPSLARSMDGIGQELLAAKSPEQIQDILLEGMTGGYLKPTEQGMKGLIAGVERTQKAYNEAIEGGLDTGQIGLRDLTSIDGVNLNNAPILELPRGAVRSNITETVLNEGVTARMKKIGGHLGRSEVVGTADTGIGTITIRHSGGNYAAYTDDGVWVGTLSVSEGGVGVAEAARRQGVGSALLDIAGDEGRAALESSQAISGSAAGLLGLSGQVAVPPATFTRIISGAATGAQGVVIRGRVKVLDLMKKASSFKKWLRTQADVDPELVARLERRVSGVGPIGGFADDELELVMRFANGGDWHMVQVGEMAALTNRGADKAVVGIDKATDAAQVASVTGETQAALLGAKAKLLSAQSGEIYQWVITDLPKRTRLGPIKGLWRKAASNDANGWFGQFRRGWSARFFNPKVPAHIDLTSAQDSINGFRRLARRFRMPREWINEATDRIARSSNVDRFGVIRDLTEEMAEKIDHPFLQYKLREYISGQGQRRFLPMDAGEEVASAASRGDLGSVTAVPVIPSHFLRKMDLPGPEFYESWRRYQRAKKWNALPTLRRGIFRGTEKNRKKIIDNIVQRLEQVASRNPELADDINAVIADPQKLAAMAYGSVFEGGIGNGIGVLGKAVGGLGTVYTGIHKIFSVSQLVGRPVSWMMRVMVDEQARGAFFDQPSLFRNPVRQLSAWWDASQTAQVGRWIQGQNQWAEDITRAIVRGQGDDLARISEAFGREVAEQLADASLATRRGVVNGLLTDIALKGGWDQAKIGPYASRWAMSRARARNRGLKRAGKIKQKYGLPEDFVWDDVTGILNKGYAQIYSEELAAANRSAQWIDGEMTEAGAYTFGNAWAAVMHQFATDPNMNLGMQIAAARAAGYSDTALIRKLQGSQGWALVRENVQRVADYRGWDYHDDATLVQRYVDEILTPQVDHVFKPFYGDDLTVKADVLNSLAKGRKQTTVMRNGNTYHFRIDPNGGADLRAEARRFAMNMTDDLSGDMPREIVAQFDPMFFSEIRDPNASMIGRFTNYMMNLFGEKPTQFFNRRGAWMSNYRRFNRHYKDVMGLPAKAASDSAAYKATETVNWVYYRLDDAVPFLRGMNKIIPFFSAAWEVGQTWAYKVPAAAGGGMWSLGAPKVARRIDQYFSAFENMGLLQKDDSGNWELILSEDLGRGAYQPVSNWLSDAGLAFVSTPFIALEHLANIGNWMGDDVDLGTEEIRFGIANPLDPVGVGIGNAMSFHLGMNPVAGYFAGKLNDDMLAALDTHRHTADGLLTLAEIGTETDIDPQAILRANEDTLRRALPSETVNGLLRGDIDPEDVVIPADVDLMLPGTSFFHNFVDDVFFPFGREETILGTAWHMQPSWAQYAWQAWGLWNSDDGHPPGYLSMLMGPQGEGQMQSAVIDALRHMDVREGVLDEVRLRAEKLQAVVSKWSDVIEADMSEADPKLIQKQGTEYEAFLEAQEEFNAAWQDLDTFSQRLLKRATDLAAGQQATRAMFGLFTPSNPRSYEIEQSLIDLYYGSEEFLEGGDLPQIKNVRDYQAFTTSLQKWMEDPTGDAAKDYFKRMFPSIEVYYKGKTYWADGGTPIEYDAIDQYFELLNAGEIKVKPPEVWIMDEAYSASWLAKEFAIREGFGHNMQEAAVEIITHPQTYNALKKEHSEELYILDYLDEMMFGGVYAAHESREDRLHPSLISEVKRDIDARFEVVNELALQIPDLVGMDANERRDFVGALRRASGEASRYWNDLKESDSWEWLNEREKLLALYYQEHVENYYNQVGDILAPLTDPKITTEDEARVWEEWRRFKNERFMIPAEVEGVVFPNELHRSWAAKDEEAKEQSRIKWMQQPLEWMSIEQSAGIREAYALEDFLPKSLKDFEVYQAFSDYKVELDEARDRGEISSYDRNKKVKQAEERMMKWLVENGREGEAAWLDYDPFTRYHVAGALPPVLEQMAPMHQAVVERLRKEDVGITSKLGRRLAEVYVQNLTAALDSVPNGWDQFQEFAIVAFGEDRIDKIVPRLFGSFGGEI